MEERTDNAPIRVLLADDHTMFRQGIASVLVDYGGIEVVGQADNDESAVEGSEGVLSGRELEILLLAARGMGNRQISRALHVAEGTVKRHLANTYRKMDVRSRGEATRKALFEEWITIRDVTDEPEGLPGA